MSIDLDDLDRMIIVNLQENARMPFSKIAKVGKVSEATVFLRVKRLQQIGVIKGFRAAVSPSKVGKSLTAFILVRADPRKYSEVLEVVRNLEEVTEAYDVTGPYYLILRIDVTSKESLAKVIDLIGGVEGVSSTETAIVLKEVKENLGVRI